MRRSAPGFFRCLQHPGSFASGIRRTLATILLCAAAPLTMAQSATDITDLILVTGQSNVQGSQTVYDPVIDASHPRILAFTSQQDWQTADLRQAWDMNGWHPGNGSLNDPNRQPYNNMAMQFARRIVERDPDRVVGFILASAPGEGIQHWDADGTFYPQIVAKVLDALNAQGVKSQLDGILWHQGETDWILEGSSDPDAVDPGPDYYPNKLDALIARLRNENWFDDGKPFICGETVAADLNTHLMALNDDGDNWTACVEGAGLPTRDGIHFNAEGLRTIGQRYADKYLQMSSAVKLPAFPAPVASDDSFSIEYGSSTNLDVMQNDQRISKAETPEIITMPALGTLSINPDGTLSYRHEGIGYAEDSFSYKLVDALFGDSNIATVTITPAADHDAQRTIAMSNIIAALETYKEAHGNYIVTGGGHRGRGNGWFHLKNSSAYPESTANVLVNAGYLSAQNNRDPLLTNPGAYSRYDFMLYRCGDRVAVFSKSDGIKTSVEHAAWWDANGCTQLPIERYNHPYFMVTGTFTDDSHDAARVAGVAQMITALESYHESTHSYRVAGGGHRGNGNGWVQHVGGNYPDSVSNVLQSLGHLSTGFIRDPLYVSGGSVKNDYMIYRCKNRVGVFSLSDEITPATEDQNWWTANNCTTIPITRYQHTYFQLSAIH